MKLLQITILTLIVIAIVWLFLGAFKSNDQAVNDNTCRIWGKMPDCVTPLEK